MEWQAHIIRDHTAPDTRPWLVGALSSCAPIGWLMTIARIISCWLSPPQSSVGPSLGRAQHKMGFLAKTLYFTLSVCNYRLADARPGFLDSEKTQRLSFEYWQFNFRSSVSPPWYPSKFQHQLNSSHIGFWLWWVHYCGARSKLQERMWLWSIWQFYWQWDFLAQLLCCWARISLTSQLWWCWGTRPVTTSAPGMTYRLS